MSNQKSNGGIAGKGYYIALILCAVAIGISGYLYYQNAKEPAQDVPAQSQQVDKSGQEDVAVVAKPNQEDTQKPSDDTKTPEKKLPTAAPVKGEAVMEYAMQTLSYNPTTRDWRVHDGVDIAAAAGTKVTAAAEGTVEAVFEDDRMGMTVRIRHQGDYITQYSSLAQEVSVSVGDKVELGQVIGCVGKTAIMEIALPEHVHFAVTCKGETVDPAEFLKSE